MLHIDIAFVGKEPGQVAQYFLNHRLKLRPQRPQPLSTFLMEQVCRLVPGKDQLFISVKLFDQFLLYGEGRERDFDDGWWELYQGRQVERSVGVGAAGRRGGRWW